MVHQCVIMMLIMLFHTKASAQVQCDHGELRLAGGSSPNVGRVEVCACTWGTVCDDDWEDRDAQVVCRQLGYRTNRAMAFGGAHFGQGQGGIFLDEVRCDANEVTLLECNHRGLFWHNCDHNDDAGVECSRDKEIMESISVNISKTHASTYNALITWTPQNTTRYQPSSYRAECFNEQHQIKMLVNNETFSLELLGLLPSTSYNCCVSAVHGSYTIRRVCIETTIIPTVSSENPRSSAVDTVGGVLGFIIVILLILLAVSVAALVYLLQPRLFRGILPKHRRHVDRNSTDVGVPVRGNISYATTPSRSTTNGPQGIQAVSASASQNYTDTDAAADYSRIGPSYETIDHDADTRREQPLAAVVAGRNWVSARLSERYELSEAHLTAVAGAASVSGGGGQVTQNLRQLQEHSDDYSHLRH